MCALTAALITAFVACPSRYWGLVRGMYPTGFWQPAVAISIEYVFLVLIAALTTALTSYGRRALSGDAAVRHDCLRIISVAVWTAPLMVLLLQRSALTGLVAAGIVVSTFSMFGITAEISPKSELSFSPIGSRIFAKLLGLAIIASGLLQAALLANWIDERMLALAFFALGAAMLAARLPASDNQPLEPVPTSGSGRRALASTLIATLLVIAGLLPQFMPVGSGDRSIDALFRRWSSGNTSAAMIRRHSERIERTRIQDGGYIGVILTPRHEKQKQLPVPPELALARRIGGLSHPLTIRFTGSYWFFQYPFIRPPFDSIKAEGDPASTGVRSSNYRPLLMEAVQTLDNPIDTTGLSTIELAMLDADPKPASVSIELVLVETGDQNRSEQSLGSQHLTAIPSFNDANHSHSETLSFPVPSQSRCKQFNQIRLIFRLDPFRDQQAAAVAIEDFVLIPNGV